MLKNAIIVCVSFAVSILGAEFLTRLVLDPVDYLAVETESDPVLNHRIGAHEGGHDAWGFRNRDVPDQTDILAIGDSMTYGMMAKSYESWPAQAQDQTGIDIYNAALGGYGPLQYLHILKTRAPELSPKAVVVMLYLGNDIMDSYNLAYSNETWADFRTEGSTDTVAADGFISTPRQVSFTRRVRSWLAQSSVLYRLATQSPLFNATRQREMLEQVSDTFVYKHLGQTVVLDPKKRLLFTDVTDPRIIEGMTILQAAMEQIAAYTRDQGLPLHVAIMPVREHVFYHLGDDTLSTDPNLQALNSNLEALEASLFQTLERAEIDFTDLRPVLEDALRRGAIYPPTDGHPNAAGYGVVAAHLAPTLSALVSAP